MEKENKKDKKEKKKPDNSLNIENKEINESVTLENKVKIPNNVISDPVWGIWDLRKPYQIPESGISIKGYSVAALRTNFFIPELGILLDAGLSAPYSNLNHIFISHGHSDHCANLPFHIYGAKLAGNKLCVHVPEESYNYLNNYIIYGYLMSSHPDETIPHQDLYVHNYYEMKKRKENEIIDLEIKNKNYFVETIKCHHSIPCLGYGFIEKRKKLKEEYLKLPGKEIQELKKQGIDINVEIELYQLLFLGDTSKKILEDEKILKYKVIMIECTFLYDDDYDQADKTFHIHWKDLRKFICDNSKNIFVLFHFSQRYSKTEITEFFEKEKNQYQFENVIPWLS